MPLRPASPIYFGMGKAVRTRTNQESCLLIVEAEDAAVCDGSDGCGVDLHCLVLGLLNKV